MDDVQKNIMIFFGALLSQCNKMYIYDTTQPSVRLFHQIGQPNRQDKSCKSGDQRPDKHFLDEMAKLSINNLFTTLHLLGLSGKVAERKPILKNANIKSVLQ